jgi:hypothetical protein
MPRRAFSPADGWPFREPIPRMPTPKARSIRLFISLKNPSFMQLPLWQRLQSFLQSLPTLLTPQPVRIEVPLDQQLSEAIAQATRDPVFRQMLLAKPKEALDSIHIHLPARQQVSVVESTVAETFLVLPVMTEAEIAILQSGAQSTRAQRAARSRIVLQAGADPEYKAKLLNNPKEVLIAEGFKIPASTAVKILEDSLEQLHLVIPAVHHHHH